MDRMAAVSRVVCPLWVGRMRRHEESKAATVLNTLDTDRSEMHALISPCTHPEAVETKQKNIIFFNLPLAP